MTSYGDIRSDRFVKAPDPIKVGKYTIQGATASDYAKLNWWPVVEVRPEHQDGYHLEFDKYVKVAIPKTRTVLQEVELTDEEMNANSTALATYEAQLDEVVAWNNEHPDDQKDEPEFPTLISHDPIEVTEEYNEYRIEKVYKLVENPAPEPRVFSKLKCYAELKELGYWSNVKAWLESSDLWDAFVLANEVSEDHPQFVEGLATMKQMLGLTDEQVNAILERCIAE